MLILDAHAKEHPATGGWMIIVATALADISLGVFHFKKTRQPDLQPDIIGPVFEDEEIRQVGDVHIWFNCKQLDEILVFLFAAQNLFDAERQVEVKLVLRCGAEALLADLPQPKIVLGPAAVEFMRLDVPLKTFSEPIKFVCDIEVGCRGREGRKVRFGRRNVLKQPSDFFSGLAAFFRTYFEIHLQPNAIPCYNELLLRSYPIWKPGDPVDFDKLLETVRQHSVVWS